MKIQLDDFEKCFALTEEVNEMRNRMEKLRAYAEGVSYALSHTSSKASGTSDRAGDGVAAIVDLEERLSRKEEIYLQCVSKVENAIEEVLQIDQRRVLRFRYIDGYDWEKIGELTHFSDRWCRELRKRGLKSLGLLPPCSSKQSRI